MKATQESLASLIDEMGFGDSRLVDAFRRVSRSHFVPADLAHSAFEDRPLPIPHGQVTTQPSLSAQMIAALELAPADQVLEVGTGYGFQTALLAVLARRVISVERWPALAEKARRNLAKAGIGNVEIRVGDGSRGAPDDAPFEALLISAAFPVVPEALVEQLCEGGRLVQPIGLGGADMVTLFRKRRSELHRVAEIVPARFVPLVPGDGDHV